MVVSIGVDGIYLQHMLLTPHTFVGIAVASTIPNMLISVPLSFLLHFAGDLLPHWDFFSNAKGEAKKDGWRILAVMGDLGAGIALGLTATFYMLWNAGDATTALNVFLCGVASVLPDALTGPSIYLKNPPRLFRFVHEMQRKTQSQAPLPWGALTQVIVVFICCLLIVNSAR